MNLPLFNPKPGRLSTLKHYKEDVESVREGQDCGLSVEDFALEKNDLIEICEKRRRETTLSDY